MIRFDDVTKFHKGKSHPAVCSLNLHIRAGEMCIFVGPSGCGKTTILRMINRLDTQDSGEIRVDGIATNEIDVVTLRRSIGFMMQNSALFPHRTVEENIATVPRLLGWDEKRVGDRINELLSLLGLSPSLLYRFPNQLSGGQQSRVALARALASDPPVILMDEPFAALDPVVRESHSKRWGYPGWDGALLGEYSYSLRKVSAILDPQARGRQQAPAPGKKTYRKPRGGEGLEESALWVSSAKQRWQPRCAEFIGIWARSRDCRVVAPVISSALPYVSLCSLIL